MSTPPMPIVKAVLAASRVLGRLRRAVTPPPLALLELTSGGYIVSCAILAATRLGVPDALAARAKTAGELAADLGVSEEPLYRVLRALAHAGVLTQRGDRFELTALSQLLTRGAPDSMRDVLLLGAEAWHHEMWGELPDIVRSGRPAHERVLGMPLFSYLEGNVEANDVFNRAMISYSARTAAAVVDAYDLSGVKTLVDVGGGVGHFLVAALARNPRCRGVLFDLGHVVGGAPAVLGAARDRVELVGGDFFDHVPPGGDVYVLMNVLHNWADDEARAILARCREALPETGRLAIVEMMISDDRPDYAAIFDLEMLVLFRGGRERTRAEFSALLEASGFRLVQTLATASPAVVLEAVPA